MAKCPHLRDAKPPPPNVLAPSLVSLGTIKKEYDDTLKNPRATLAKVKAARKRLVAHYQGLHREKEADDFEKPGHSPVAVNQLSAPAPIELEQTEGKEKAKGCKPEPDREGFTKIQRRNHKRQKSDSSQQGRWSFLFQWTLKEGQRLS